MPKILPLKNESSSKKAKRRKCNFGVETYQQQMVLDYENLKIRMGDQTGLLIMEKSNDTVKSRTKIQNE